MMRSQIGSAAMSAATATDFVDDVRAPTKKSPIEVSAGLAAWIIRHRVSLAFSSYQNGDLFFLGAQGDGRAVFSRAQFPYAMGIAAFAQRVYLASNMQIWRLENILKPDELANDRYDRLFVPRNAQVIGPLDMHELGVEPSGRIVFANTKYSCLATPSISHSFQPVWRPKFISKLAPEDRCHCQRSRNGGGSHSLCHRLFDDGHRRRMAGASCRWRRCHRHR